MDTRKFLDENMVLFFHGDTMNSYVTTGIAMQAVEIARKEEREIGNKAIQTLISIAGPITLDGEPIGFVQGNFARRELALDFIRSIDDRFKEGGWWKNKELLKDYFKEE